MNKFVETKIQFENKSSAFCIVDGKRCNIKPKFLNKALPNDLILLKVKDGKYGFVQKVILRNESAIIGQLQVTENGSFIKPWSKLYHKDFFVDNKSLNGAEDGDAVEFKFKEWKNEKLPKANIKKVLFNSTSEHFLIHKLGLPKKFPDNVLREAQGIKLNYKYSDRVDLTHLNIFSIDPENTKDIDDALSIEKMEYGYRVGVHIADVSHYIKSGSLIDHEAFKRGTSVYLTDKLVVPMIPPNLSNNILSLVPNEERLALTFFINVDHDYIFLSYSILRSVIRSKNKFSYKEAEEHRLDNKSSYHDSINKLSEIGEVLRNLFFPKEILFETNKVTFKDNDENDKCVVITEHFKTNSLIQSWMLLTNMFATKQIEELGVDKWLYRVHPDIDDSKLNELKKELSQLNLSWDDNLSVKDNIFKLNNSPLKGAILKKFKPAYYSDSKDLHFGLGSNQYTHITSPIRRYPDIMNHRILVNSLKEKKIIIGNLSKDAKKLSKSEKRAESCEKYAYNLCAMNFIKDIKYPLDAKILYFTKKGAYIKTEFEIEGWVFFKDEKWDDTNRKFITAEDWKIGDSIKVKLQKLDWNDMDIIFQFA